MSGAEAPADPRSIAIVGAGIIGLSAAWQLVQAGWRVTVFDQAEIGSEASWAGAGMLAPGGEIVSEAPLAMLALESCQLYPAFVRGLESASGVEIDYQQCGALELAYSQPELDSLERKALRQAGLGILSKAVPLGHIRQFWPRVRREGLLGARFYPGDSLVNPRQVVEALRIACQRAGVLLYPNRAVTKISVLTDEVVIERTGAPERFDALALAAGAWSDSIALEGVPKVPEVRPVKGHLIGYQQPDQTCSTIIRNQHTYILQRANGLLIVGASVEQAGFNRELKAEVIEDLTKQAASVLPHLAETTPSESWIGFRPASENPQIGAWHSRRLYLAYGHYRNGILLAPVTAQKLSLEISANFEMP